MVAITVAYQISHTHRTICTQFPPAGAAEFAAFDADDNDFRDIFNYGVQERCPVLMLHQAENDPALVYPIPIIIV